MDAEILAQFDATRDLSAQGFRSCCYAPFTSLYFDTLGSVRVCCQNTEHPVGNVASSGLDEIWHGAQVAALRAALQAGDMSRGCRFCHWELAERNFQGVFIRNFDVLAVADRTPQWPAQFEFALSNTCNLECVMCNGEWSSLIRSRRERLPPLPKPYGERFFADVRKYLPHLQRAKFLGGEPFLSAEALRIWEMMIDDGLQTPCFITSNGTQLNAKVERILDRLPVSLSLSLDGVTKHTVENIRVNAKFEELQRNVRRFRDYTRQRGTYFGLTFCLMRDNWPEFADYLLLAQSLDCEVVVNVVTFPRKVSLYSLPAAELTEVVRGLEQRDAEMRRTLGDNLTVWNAELGRLRHRAAALAKAEQPYFVPRWDAAADPSAADERVEALVQRAQNSLARLAPGEPIDLVECDRDDVVQAIRSDSDRFLGVGPEVLVGQPLQIMLAQLMAHFGSRMQLLRDEKHAEWGEQILALAEGDQPPTLFAAVTIPRRDAQGNGNGSWIVATRLPEPPQQPLLSVE